MTEPFLLSGYAAKVSDALVYAGDKNWYLRPLCGLACRFNNAIIFQILVALDFLGHGTKALGEWAWSELSSNPTAKKEYLELANMNYDTVQRCFLGTLFAQATWIASDIVSQHFIPKTEKPGIIEHNGKLYSARAVEKTPASIEELQQIIRDAKRDEKKVAIVGAGMSQGKQALPPGKDNIVINLKQLNAIKIDASAGIAKVQAGATWCELQNEANNYGLAVKVQQASNVFSIGGSLSANCHGWDHHTGPVGNTVRSITIVDANGDLVYLQPEDRLFQYVLGGYGGFGVIVDAEIELAQNEYLIESGKEVAPKDYIKHFQDSVQNDDNIAMHLYRLSLDPDHLFETGIAVNYSKTGEGAGAAKLVNEPHRGNRMDRIKIHALRCIPGLIKLAWKMEKSGATTTRKALRTEFMRPPINPVFNNSQVDTEWLQEFFFKGEDLDEFRKFLAKTLTENQVPVYNASVRFVKQDNLAKLGYATEGDRFAIVLFFNQSLIPEEVEKTRRWVQKVIDYLAQRDGTYYLPYQHFATKEQFRACYPQWERVARAKGRFDPDGVFQNGIYQDYIS